MVSAAACGRTQVRSELCVSVEREGAAHMQHRLTDLFWKLSADVIKSLMTHKVDATSLEPQRSASEGCC